jgi:exopolyphosphatase/pppGpp-phosphohydrolase
MEKRSHALWYVFGDRARTFRIDGDMAVVVGTDTVRRTKNGQAFTQSLG